MKKQLLLLLGLFLSFQALGQYEEFESYENGLIYSPTTMDKLAHIVDSLNLKYKSCDLNKTFYALPQTIGYYFKVPPKFAGKAKKDIEKNIPFKRFKRKYPKATIEKDVLIVKDHYTYEEKEGVTFHKISFDNSRSAPIHSEQLVNGYNDDLKNEWVYKTGYKGGIYGFYFPKPFETPTLPNEYARMIGYADCLIDTTALKFKENAKRGRFIVPNEWAQLSFSQKENLLDTMRATRVVGYCSQDRRPRTHAINIAILSAETTKWEVFLRAHLDIMNDRFERNSDASSAWAQRKTYIKELEELDINVTDLILGICLRIKNKANNHYYGNISRLGRALAETKNKKAIEDLMLTMISDNRLDNYNRALVYFMYRSYCRYTPDEKAQKASLDKLKQVVNKLPKYFRSKIKFDTQ